MNVLVPLLLASFFPQGTVQDPPRRLPTKTGRITLPPIPRQTKTQNKPVRVRNDADSFYRDVIDLRRSKSLTAVAEARLLNGLKANYDDPASMAVDLSSNCKSDLVFGLMKVVDRYGRSIHAEKLHFQLLTRPMGQVTSRVVRTVVKKAGERAKSYLFDYLTVKFAPLRAVAAKLIGDYLIQEDIPRLLRLSRERKADVRRRILEVLARIDDDRVRKRILELLTLDAALAGDACRAAIVQGRMVAPELVAIVNRPAKGRAFGYAAFALVKIQKALGQSLLTKTMVPHLVRELTGDDPLLKSTSAIALGAYAYRATDWQSSATEDKLIVDGLLDLVAPEAFITGLRMLQPAAHEILVRFSGHDLRGGSVAWRGWWSESRGRFIGLRRSIVVTAANAERVAILWRAGEHVLSFRGAKVAVDWAPADAARYILTVAQMQGLVAHLRGLGFMSDHVLPRTPEVWSVDMRVDNTRAMLLLAANRGKAMHRTFADVARREMWQRYRDPVAQPDAAAFWRMENRWLAANPGKESERLLHHILRVLPKLDGKGRERALSDLQSVPGLPGLITDANASTLIDIANGLEKLAKSDFRLLEVALLAKGDTTWRKVIGVLDGRIIGAGDALATRLFGLLGPERVVTSIRHKSRPIAVAAMHDVAVNRNQTAVPVLLTRLHDSDREVQRTAIYALGVLHATPARESLIKLEAVAYPALRRQIWSALGRIGGSTVPAILKRAMENPNLEDKLAAIAAMGYTQNAEMAQFLAARYVTQAGKLDAFAQRAELALHRIGPLLAIPALRPHLQMQDGPARQRLILLLGEFQDPRVVRDLIDLLRLRQHEAIAARYLAEITGVDLRGIEYRVRKMYAWFADNRLKGQAQWYLAALAGAKIKTTLQIQQLTRGSGVGGVEELARLLTTVPESHLRVMTSTLLRETTGKDYTRGVRHATASGLVAIGGRYKTHAATVRAAAK